MLRTATVALAAAASVCAACARNGDVTTTGDKALRGNIGRVLRFEASDDDPHRLLRLLDRDVMHALRDARLPAGVPWLDDAGAESQRIERIRIAEQAARATLVEIFGEAARHAPAFWYLFTPLVDRMPELGSEEQIAIHDLERRFIAAGHAGGAQQRFADHLANIRSVAGERTAREYALRTSPLAAELRNAGIDLSEAEFRSAYDVLATVAGSRDGLALVEARGKLQALLGGRRFARLWAQRDPRFARLKAVAAGFGLRDDTVIAGYAVLLDAHDSMLATALHADGSEATSQDALRTLHESGRRRLTEIVGSSAADAMMRAFASAAELRPGA